MSRITLRFPEIGTLLLGASNYTQQILAAPIRKEIDMAHRSHVWLDIGTQSLRNLRRINRRKAILWILLSISSIPLHLM